MIPGRTGAVEPIEISLPDESARQKIVVLFRTRNRREDVKRRQLGIEFQQRPQVIVDGRFRVFRKADDVGKVCRNSVLAAQPHNFAVDLRMILRLPRRQQRLAAEGLDAQKYLEASCPGKQFDQVFLFADLGVALDKKRQLHVF
jgi:hypothetical protein